MSVCVLEARNRVGGRTLDHPISGGHIVEGGGQYAGPGQDRVLALAKDLGIATFPTFQDGKVVLTLAGLRLALPAYQADSADLGRVGASGVAGGDRPYRRPLDCPACPRVGRSDGHRMAGEEHA